MDVITGRDNKKLKFARAVRDGRERGFIFLEGARLAVEAFRSDINIVDTLISESFGTADHIPGVDPTIVADRLFDSIAETKSSQGIILIAERPETSIRRISNAIDREPTGPFLILFLHEINNPANLGAIMRTAEAAGVKGVIVSKGSADVFSPKALRSAMGSSLRVPICENADFDETIIWAKGVGLTSTAADINASRSYTQTDWGTSRLLVFGSEAHGLDKEKRERIDELILIPMENEVESLNLAVSCGIILFEAKRQVPI